MNFNGYLTAVTCGYSIVSPIVPISKLNLTLAVCAQHTANGPAYEYSGDLARACRAQFDPEHKY